MDFTRIEPGESKAFYSQTPTVDYYPIWAGVRFIYAVGPGVGHLREVRNELTLTPLVSTTSFTAATSRIPYTEMRESIVTQIIWVPVTVARGITSTDVMALLFVAVLLGAPLSVLVYTRTRKKPPPAPPAALKEIATMITCDFERTVEGDQSKGVLSGRLTRSDTGEGLADRPLQLRPISSEYLMFDLNTDSEGHWRFEHEMFQVPDIMWSANISFQGDSTFSSCAASTIQANK